MSEKSRKTLSRLGSGLFWLLLWFLLAARVGQELLLPSPLQVLRTLLCLTEGMSFWQSVAASLLRVLAGLLAGCALGLLLGFLTYVSRLTHALVAPMMTLVKSTPVASFIILALVWLGRNIVPMCITCLMVLPVVWANVSAGLAAQEPQLRELMQVYRLPRLRRFCFLTVPTVLPHFRAALRSALGLGWKAGIAAEVLTVPQRSIGRMIYESKLYLETTELFAWTLTVILLSLLIEKLLLQLVGGAERREEGRHA